MTSGLKQRLKTAIIIGIPILFLLFYNVLTQKIFLSLLIILCSVEYLNINYKGALMNWKPMVSFLMSVLLLYVGWGGFGISPVILIVSGVIFNVLLLLHLFYSDSNVHSKYPWIINPLYTAVPLASLLSTSGSSSFNYLLIGVLLLIWVSDISAYFVGKSIGKRKLMPTVSPGKTREGFMGAGLVTVLFSYIFYAVSGHFSLQVWCLIALAVWLFGSLGDLVESKMKRQLNIKDSGSILPGHGGFLDRFDGFYFCLPFVLMLTKLLGYI